MTAPTTAECESLAQECDVIAHEEACDRAAYAQEGGSLHPPGELESIASRAAAALRAVAAERDAKDKRIASMVWTADQMVWRRCDGEGRPQPGHDCRAIVVLHDDEGMCWIGIRAWCRDALLAAMEPPK